MSMVPAKTARLVFAGGGTGGHLYPAIAIADRIVELLKDRRQVEIAFVGTKRGIEYRIKDTLGYPLHLINVRGLTRSLALHNLVVPFVLVSALFKSRSLLKRLRPDVVVGTGGYVALPVLKAAHMLKIPTVIQEQNSFPGITTRKLAGKARRVYLGFAGANQYLTTDGRVITTGNPARSDIAAGNRSRALDTYKLDPKKKTVLVMGGSQGARAVNNAVIKSLKDKGMPDGYQLLWQTGKRDYKDVVSSLGDNVQGHALFPFAEDMASVYAAADIAIARAGAISLAELEACALPSVLVPFPQAAGDHQRKNAAEYAARGYAVVVDQREFDTIDVLQRAVSLVESSEAARFRDNLRRDTAGRKPAVDVIAEDIISLIEQNQNGENAVD